MKNDLLTSIVVAIIGVVAAYFVCNIFSGDIKPFSIKNLDSSVSAGIAEPDPEVFNYRALNPTVEVYVGDCEKYDDSGECIDEDSNQIDKGTISENIEPNQDEGQ